MHFFVPRKNWRELSFLGTLCILFNDIFSDFFPPGFRYFPFSLYWFSCFDQVCQVRGSRCLGTFMEIGLLPPISGTLTRIKMSAHSVWEGILQLLHVSVFRFETENMESMKSIAPWGTEEEGQIRSWSSACWFLACPARSPRLECNLDFE